jgi:uncharacterized protein YdaU (DUF1376 family)
MNYYSRHLGDYARSAGYLTLAEHGAYNLLMDWYFANERPIPREDAYAICKAFSLAEKKAVLKVLETFFKWEPDLGWYHKRIEIELVKMRELSAKKRNAANQRWNRNSMQMHSESNSGAMQSNNQYPITNIQRPNLSQISPSMRKSQRSDTGLMPVAELLPINLGR